MIQKEFPLTRDEIESLEEVSGIVRSGFTKGERGEKEEKPTRVWEKCLVCKTAMMFDSKDGVTCGRSICRDGLIDKIDEMEEKLRELEDASDNLASKEAKNERLSFALRRIYEAIKIVFPPDAENTPQVIDDLLKECKKTLY